MSCSWQHVTGFVWLPAWKWYERRICHFSGNHDKFFGHKHRTVLKQRAQSMGCQQWAMLVDGYFSNAAHHNLYFRRISNFFEDYFDKVPSEQIVRRLMGRAYTAGPDQMTVYLIERAGVSETA